MLNQQGCIHHMEFIMSDTNIVIVTRDASFKLDNSMCVIDGSYESGYVYDEDIFMIEGIKAQEFYFVGDCSHVYFKKSAPAKTITAVGEYWIHIEFVPCAAPEFNGWAYTIYDNEGQIKYTTCDLELFTAKQVVDNYKSDLYYTEFIAIGELYDYDDFTDELFDFGDYDGDTLYAELDDIFF